MSAYFRRLIQMGHRTKYLILILAFIGCVESFTPPTSNYQDLLVVEAFITDQPSSHFVKLSRSYPINSRQNISVPGATVMLRSSNGQLHVFDESEPGLYMAGPGFIPKVGETYTLSVVTRDGASFTSKPVVMKETPPIKNIFYERKSRPSEEKDLEEGYQIYVNSKSNADEKIYMKYEWDETWEFATPFESFLDYNFETNTAFLRDENISICWQNEKSFEIIVATNEGRISESIDGQPIRFVSFGEHVMRIKYSILVKQFALKEESFRFWENLKESNESTGSLYDTQPFQVRSNIENDQDKNTPVLGYFDMATESSKRIFITKDDLPPEISIPTYYPQCLSGADTVVSARDAPVFLRQGYLIETTIPPPLEGFTIVLQRCIDCRLRGSNKKPEFWE